ncbi:MAG TPA: sugar ABC transporter permease [Microvirga sp.]|jgi:trehalose/maltose transport system permease protein|nr:sugar ABC transporter permease [Microvirga sp.]
MAVADAVVDQERGSGAQRAAVADAPSRLDRRRTKVAWLFLLPVIVALVLVAGWPLTRTILFSFTDARLSTLDAYETVGLSNYLYLVEDPAWWQAVKNTFVFTLVSVSIETVLGVAIALALNAHFRGRGLLRAAVLIPWAIPTVISAKMWGWMYHDLYGVINVIFLSLGFIERSMAWTADPALAMAAMIAVDVWKTTPFMALLALAALQLIPNDLYEASRIDGVSPVKVFFRITLPLIGPALMVAVIFRALDALRVFDLPFVLTGNNQDTATMSVYARQQLVDFQDVGFGSAASTLLFLIIALVTVIILMSGRVGLPSAGK